MLLPYTFRPSKITEPHLVTIPYSHYCEVARWALQTSGIDFREAMYAPGYHARVVGRLRSDRSSRSTTSYVGQESGAHAGRRKFSVPLLCMPDGSILRDSWEILEHALGPPEPEWKELMDRELGVCVRQIAYHYVLTAEGEHLLRSMMAGASRFERALWMFFRRMIMDEMRRLMAVNEANVQESKRRVLELMQRAGQSLRTHGGTLQPTGEFGATEVAFCGLAAICTFPEGYGNGALVMPPLTAFPTPFQDFVRECRDTDAGRWVMQSYRDHRSRRTHGAARARS
jgi:glutathione S-transferase